MQNGSLLRSERQRGPAVWEFRWREFAGNGKRRHRRIVLGPVNLNLLGLVVTLGGGPMANQPIVLDITAVSGPGNLLGNLLCGVSNLLNGPGTTSLTSGLTAGLLNLVNSLLNTPGLLRL